MEVKYSIIGPCYNEEESIMAFYSAIIPVMESLNEKFEIIFINDGSTDKTEQILSGIASNDKRVKVINFSKNFGQQQAILAGFQASCGEAVINIDVDLQDPVEAIPEMIEKWKEGFDIVHGKRKIRKGETFFKKKTASLYTKFFEKITGLKIPKNCGDFKLFDRKVVDVIANMPERNRFLRGITEWVGFKQGFVEFERQERFAGKTKYNLKRLVNLATDGIVSNSSYPLTLTFKFGVASTVISVLTFLSFIILECFKIHIPLVGWIFPALVLLFGINWMLSGINNIFTDRIYREVQDRPKFIISSTINIDKKKDEK